jgi:hypothetical protein
MVASMAGSACGRVVAGREVACEQVAGDLALLAVAETVRAVAAMRKTRHAGGRAHSRVEFSVPEAEKSTRR